VAHLSRFLKDEIPRRGWTIPTFARRANLSNSNAYLIVRDGKDNVTQDTFDDIATALDMAPAELMVAIGKGNSPEDAERVVMHATVRQIPKANLSLAQRLLLAFVSPQPSPEPNPPVSASAQPRISGQTQALKRTKHASGGGLTGRLLGLYPALAMR
jgi:transcriptional regulator with XRE-family HTH domain